MMQFGVKRFRHLARWTWAMDRRWFIKVTSAWAVVLTLMYLFFTCVLKQYDENDAISYEPCFFMTVASSIAIFVLGGSFMFQSFKTKHDDQRYMLLPASNLEKFLMRYCVWLLSLPCFLLAFVAADIVQWLVNTILSYKGTMLMMPYLADKVCAAHWSSDVFRSVHVSSVLIVIWLHSVYVLGATFFRSHKYNWVFTSLVLIVGGTILVSLCPHGDSVRVSDDQTTSNSVYPLYVILMLLIMLNFWLSYKFFCRQQIVGKFVNI